jgi:hypothetical protein
MNNLRFSLERPDRHEVALADLDYIYYRLHYRIDRPLVPISTVQYYFSIDHPRLTWKAICFHQGINDCVMREFLAEVLIVHFSRIDGPHEPAHYCRPMLFAFLEIDWYLWDDVCFHASRSSADKYIAVNPEPHYHLDSFYIICYRTLL